MKCKLPKGMNETFMKKATDGIIDVLLRMYEKDESGKDFGNFCIWIQSLSAEEFYKLPIAKKNETDNN